MLRSFLVVLVLIFFTSSNYAQTASPFSAGKWEINMAGSLGSIKQFRDYKSFSGATTSNFSDTHTYLQLYVMPAYYVTDGLAIEPEFGIFLYQKSRPAYSLLANISYTMALDNPNVAPFVRVGYGLSNSVGLPTQSDVLNRVSDKFDVPTLNFGAGVKFMVANNVLIRTEVNYRSVNWSTSSSSGYGSNYSYSYEYNYSIFSALFGFSVIL